MRVLAVALVAGACAGGAKPPTPVPATPAPEATAPAASTPAAPPTAKPAPAVGWAQAPMTLAQAGIVPGWIDRAADPCGDFYAFACGGFMKTAQIPPDRTGWGAIELAVKDAEDFLHTVLEAAAKDAGGDPVRQKIGDHYAACMDEATIERAGTAPLQPLLAPIDALRDGATAAAALTHLHAHGMFPMFAIGQQQDFADATQVIAGMDQSGLGLPDRDYYLEAKGAMADKRAVYKAHLVRLFQLAGKPAATAATWAQKALDIETQLARLQMDKVARRDPRKIYHRVERAGLEGKIAPTFPWGAYLTALGVPQVTAISVHDPAYFTAIAKLLRTGEPLALRAYLTAAVLRHEAGQLGKAWVDEAFAFQKALSGIKELPPRWRRCVRQVDGDLGELLGQAYVKARFSTEAKTRAAELTRAVLDAMRAELAVLPWMDDATRAQARQKLDKMAYLVGYPDRWKTYDFPIRRDDFAGNVHAADAWEQARQLAKIGKPVDRTDWLMSPPTVNAYYEPTLNEIALPAGQLQPPFFGASFHPAVNFGSTGGGTIGHEMIHGFDDEGRQFDADGNLRDWWSAPTATKFGEATACVVDQYARYEAVPGVKLNGKLTAGENIADNGGVKLGLQAYQAWKQTQTPPPPAKVEGFTDEQLYFLAYGQSWCHKQTPESLELMARANPHSPAMWRVNGVIVNQPGFGPAFGCKAGAPMSPANRCNVW